MLRGSDSHEFELLLVMQTQVSNELCSAALWEDLITEQTEILTLDDREVLLLLGASTAVMFPESCFRKVVAALGALLEEAAMNRIGQVGTSLILELVVSNALLNVLIDKFLQTTLVKQAVSWSILSFNKPFSWSSVDRETNLRLIVAYQTILAFSFCVRYLLENFFDRTHICDSCARRCSQSYISA